MTATAETLPATVPASDVVVETPPTPATPAQPFYVTESTLLRRINRLLKRDGESVHKFKSKRSPARFFLVKEDEIEIDFFFDDLAEFGRDFGFLEDGDVVVA